MSNISFYDLKEAFDVTSFAFVEQGESFFDFIQSTELSINIGDTGSFYSDGQYVFLTFEGKDIIKWEAEYFKATYLNYDRLSQKRRYTEADNLLKVFYDEAELT